MLEEMGMSGKHLLLDFLAHGYVMETFGGGDSFFFQWSLCIMNINRVASMTLKKINIMQKIVLNDNKI